MAAIRQRTEKQFTLWNEVYYTPVCPSLHHSLLPYTTPSSVVLVIIWLLWAFRSVTPERQVWCCLVGKLRSIYGPSSKDQPLLISLDVLQEREGGKIQAKEQLQNNSTLECSKKSTLPWQCPSVPSCFIDFIHFIHSLTSFIGFLAKPPVISSFKCVVYVL